MQSGIKTRQHCSVNFMRTRPSMVSLLSHVRHLNLIRQPSPRSERLWNLRLLVMFKTLSYAAHRYDFFFGSHMLEVLIKCVRWSIFLNRQYSHVCAYLQILYWAGTYDCRASVSCLQHQAGRGKSRQAIPCVCNRDAVSSETTVAVERTLGAVSNGWSGTAISGYLHDPFSLSVEDAIIWYSAFPTNHSNYIAIPTFFEPSLHSFSTKSFRVATSPKSPADAEVLALINCNSRVRFYLIMIMNFDSLNFSSNGVQLSAEAFNTRLSS